MNSNIWQLQDAKSKFSQLVENAMHNKPHFLILSWIWKEIKIRQEILSYEVPLRYLCRL